MVIKFFWLLLDTQNITKINHSNSKQNLKIENRSPLQEISKKNNLNQENERPRLSGKDIFELVTQGTIEHQNPFKKTNVILSPLKPSSKNSSLQKSKTPVLSHIQNFKNFSKIPIHEVNLISLYSLLIALPNSNQTPSAITSREIWNKMKRIL